VPGPRHRLERQHRGAGPSAVVGAALVGGVVGAAVADGILSGSGGLGSVQWGGFDGWHPTGVIGVLVALLISRPSASPSRSCSCAYCA
jgi:hypothetical protein